MSAVQSLAAGVALIGISTMVIQGVDRAVSPPPDRVLRLEQLHWDADAGGVVQQLSGNIEAEWKARFYRRDNGWINVLCRGGADGIYVGEVQRYTPDEWTFADCPELQSGDIGRASWTYTDLNGFQITIIGEFTIP